MKATDRLILIGFITLGAIAAFYFLVLSPKRQEASDLAAKADELRASVAEQEEIAEFAQLARKDYGDNYHRLVVLGKAVPEDADTPSLLVQLQRLSDKAKIDFRSATLSATGGEGPAPSAGTAAGSAAGAAPPAGGATPPAGGAAPPAGGAAPPAGGATPPAAASSGAAQPAAAGAPAADEASASATSASTTGTATEPAAPTEATAAALPLGAAVGPAGLPAMPYELEFKGGFFEVADFFDGLDDMVHTTGEQTTVDGRLLTVDGFSIGMPETTATAAAAGTTPDSTLDVSLFATSYLTPEAQGLTAGATPDGPALAADSASSTTTAP